jgi:hypothetical protein
MTEIITRIEEQNKLEKSEVILYTNFGNIVYVVKNYTCISVL